MKINMPPQRNAAGVTPFTRKKMNTGTPMHTSMIPVENRLGSRWLKGCAANIFVELAADIWLSSLIAASDDAGWEKKASGRV